MALRRVVLCVLFLGLGIVGTILLRGQWSSSVFADYTAGNFTAGSNSTEYAYDSATNVYIGSFTLPDPLADTILIDGAGNTVAAKNVITAFSSSNQMFDTDNDGALDSIEGIIQSANTTLDSADTALTTATSALTSFATTEGTSSYYVFFDQGATSSSYDSGEDVYRQVFQNLACSSADAVATIRVPESTLAFLDLDSDDVIDWEPSPEVYGIYGETIFRDADADSKPSAGDSIIVTQGSRTMFFAAGDNICFDGSIVNDAEYDPGEVIWKDSAGDCSAFTSTTDFILVGVAAPAGTSTLASTENELGYFDTNNSTAFDCTRAGTCEPPVYSGANATSVGGGFNVFISASAAFFDSSVEGTDGIRTTGIAWDESGGAENVKDWSEIPNSGDSTYLYTDCNSNTTFDSSEDVFFQVVTGATAVMTNGLTARTFDANERALLTPGTAITAFNATSGAIVKSADAHLTTGALNGSGTDQVLSSGVVLDAIPSGNRYYDHDASGSFAVGDDVVVDVDSSGYYNADDILSTQVTAAASSDAITDSYLSGVYIYERVGNSCAGSGTDTLLGSDVSTPFLAQTIALTKAAYAASDSVASRSLCVYADIANNSVHGKIWAPEIPVNGTVFSSNSSSPTSAFSMASSPVQFVVSVPVTTTASITNPSASATYRFLYTITEDAVLNAKGLFDVTFPSGFNIASSSTACTGDGSTIAVTPTISSQSIRAVNASGSTVTVGTAIVCTVSGVVNPSTVGTTGTFTIGTDNGTTNRRMGIDVNNTVSITASGGGIVEPVTNSLTLISPNGGESLTAGVRSTISWSTTGTGISFVNILYSADSGSSWETLVTKEDNIGLFTWTVPSTATSSALVKIEGTDLVTTVDEDSSDAVFAVVASSSSSGATTEVSTDAATDTASGEEVEPVVSPVPETTSTLTEGMFVKIAESPTIYVIDENLIRHPFFDPQTFFTYQESFGGVLTVDNETLSQSVLGKPQPVNAYTILVRFESFADVYTVNIDSEGGVFLRPIANEADAIAVFGSTWGDRVIALSDGAMPYYVFHSEDETSESLSAWAASTILTDKWHLAYPDSALDADNDGAATWLEASWGTQPYDSDTDNDGYADWLEMETGHSPFLDGGR